MSVTDKNKRRRVEAFFKETIIRIRDKFEE